MNVIVLVSDTFRYDYLGCCGSSWVRTPNLDALAEESLVFTLETTLDDNATIKVYPDNPKACGHYVRVCLTFGTP